MELTDGQQFYIIIESKRGWMLPGADQLTLYTEREKIRKSHVKHKAIVSMSEYSMEYANSYLSFMSKNCIPILHLPWKRIYEIAYGLIIDSSISQKNMLRELIQPD